MISKILKTDFDKNELSLFETFQNMFSEMNFLTCFSTHIESSGKFRVMLPADSGPYLMYPKNPTIMYNKTIITIPKFSTPQVPPKLAGVFMLFSRAIICNVFYNYNFLLSKTLETELMKKNLQGNLFAEINKNFASYNSNSNIIKKIFFNNNKKN